MKRILCIAFFASLVAGQGATVFRGVVLGPDGEPVAGARLTLRAPHAGCTLVSGYSFLSTVTDERGRFQFEQPPVPMEVEARHADLGLAWAEAGNGVQLRFARGAYLTGKANAPCRLRATLGLRELAAADVDGEFRFGPLPPGVTFTLRAGSACHRPYHQDLSLDPGETRAFDVHLDAGATLSGRAAPGATVRASQGEAHEVSAIADREGVFTLRGLRDGAVCVVALRPGGGVTVVHGETGTYLDVEAAR
ncbi:MAG: carboxypeptidase-like regulatory domain-containing protein [Planctomycetota bacterium]|jgi:hypothetical protein